MDDDVDRVCVLDEETLFESEVDFVIERLLDDVTDDDSETSLLSVGDGEPVTDVVRLSPSVGDAKDFDGVAVADGDAVTSFETERLGESDMVISSLSVVDSVWLRVGVADTSFDGLLVRLDDCSCVTEAVSEALALDDMEIVWESEVLDDTVRVALSSSEELSLTENDSDNVGDGVPVVDGNALSLVVSDAEIECTELSVRVLD